MQRALFRPQATQLLSKFVRCEIIRKVEAKEGELYEFTDSRDLYTFTSFSSLSRWHPATNVCARALTPITNQDNSLSPVAEPANPTKMWNEVVYAFCVGIPLKKHRKHLKSYDDCFVAKYAVDWVHHYLIVSRYFSRHQVSR